jgi:hypothetical protein
MKKITVISIGILFVWFTIDITGFTIGKIILVVSAFKDEPIDILWWGVFIAALILFIFKEKIGKYIMLAFLAIWAFIQGKIYFRDEEGIQGYYNFFYNEGTHRLIPASDSFLVKDTYHIFIDLFILISLVCITIFILEGLIKSKKYKIKK